MELIAKSILFASISPIKDKRYESIPEIVKAKPKVKDGTQVALYQIDKTNVIVAWYTKAEDEVQWMPASGFFVVMKKHVHERGARYTKEKAEFVRNNYDDIKHIVIGASRCDMKNRGLMDMIRKARAEIGYSDATAVYDIYYALTKEFNKQTEENKKNIKR